MAVYRHTCPLKALQRDLPMQPPLISLEIVSFCLYSGCVHHEKKMKLHEAVKAIRPSISCHYANRPHHSLPKWISWGWRNHQPCEARNESRFPDMSPGLVAQVALRSRTAPISCKELKETGQEVTELVAYRRASAALYTYKSSLTKMPLPPLSSTEHLKVKSTLLSQAAQIQTEQLSSKSKSKTTNCFDWSLHTAAKTGVVFQVFNFVHAN